jgi:N-acetylglucosamine-6-phosphate deacetylase
VKRESDSIFGAGEPMSIFFQNIILHTSEEVIPDGAVLVENGMIAAAGPRGSFVPPPGAAVMDGQGLVLAPGMIDLQLNGGFGYDFTSEPASLWDVAAHLPRYGVTAFLPTIITSPPEVVHAAIAALRHASGGGGGAVPLGLHLEGPFINPAKKGAHNPDYIRLPQAGSAADWTLQNGVRLVTLAPELPGALDLASRLLAGGVVVSAGHSMATFDQARSAFDSGVRYGTHLFNAMPALDHRQPGLAGALLTDSRMVTGLIADGIHVHPAMVALAWKGKGSRGLSLVTDAMTALGMPAGDYRLGDRTVKVDAVSARLPDGTLAGSILTLDQAVRNLMAFSGASLVEVLPAVTGTPARLLGLERKGRIAAGCDADLILLSPGGQIFLTMVSGEIVYSRL